MTRHGTSRLTHPVKELVLNDKTCHEYTDSPCEGGSIE